MNGIPGTRHGRRGVYRGGHIELLEPVAWPDGTPVLVRPAHDEPSPDALISGDVIIAGFGLGGRYVADLLEKSAIAYVVVERNAETVKTQRALGRRVIDGDVSQRSTLEQAGAATAAALALTIPDERAVIRATGVARELNPALYIIARTTHASCAIKAKQLGADEVINAEQLAATLFHDKLRAKIGVGLAPRRGV